MLTLNFNILKLIYFLQILYFVSFFCLTLNFFVNIFKHKILNKTNIFIALKNCKQMEFHALEEIKNSIWHVCKT